MASKIRDNMMTGRGKPATDMSEENQLAFIWKVLKRIETAREAMTLMVDGRDSPPGIFTELTGYHQLAQQSIDAILAGLDTLEAPLIHMGIRLEEILPTSREEYEDDKEKFLADLFLGALRESEDVRVYNAISRSLSSKDRNWPLRVFGEGDRMLSFHQWATDLVINKDRQKDLRTVRNLGDLSVKRIIESCEKYLSKGQGE